MPLLNAMRENFSGNCIFQLEARQKRVNFDLNPSLSPTFSVSIWEQSFALNGERKMHFPCLCSPPKKGMIERKLAQTEFKKSLRKKCIRRKLFSFLHSYAHNKRKLNKWFLLCLVKGMSYDDIFKCCCSPTSQNFLYGEKSFPFCFQLVFPLLSWNLIKSHFSCKNFSTSIPGPII